MSFSGFISKAMSLSDLKTIDMSKSPFAVLPKSIFGQEPPHEWCYYFEKAELARQDEDWEEIAKLGEKALSLNKDFNHKNIPEIMPYIEAFAHIGQWDKAVELSLDAFEFSNTMQDLLCDRWRGILKSTPANIEQQNAVGKIQIELSCDQLE